MRFRSMWNLVAIGCACTFLAVLAGCAGLEYAPKRTILYYHKELPAAERAVEAARAAGKDKECPAEFQAAEKLASAAAILGREPSALQLRYLQTLLEIGAEQNSTIVFPLPLDMLRPFLDGAARVNQAANGVPTGT